MKKYNFGTVHEFLVLSFAENHITLQQQHFLCVRSPAILVKTFFDISFVCLFVWLDSLCPSQQFFSYVGMGLPGLNQYIAMIN